MKWNRKWNKGSKKDEKTTKTVRTNKIKKVKVVLMFFSERERERDVIDLTYL